MDNAPRITGRMVTDACLAMGFALAGVAPATPSDWRDEFVAWLASGSHGDMGYLAEQVEERLDIRRLLPGAKSVIVVADVYAVPGSAASDGAASEPAPTGTIAKYARGRDYHEVIRKRLWMLVDRLRERCHGAEFRPFVDSGPVLEREHAVRAGLGGAFIGKHTLLISPQVGSYLLLGGVATTLEFADQDASSPSEAVSHCGSCTKCIDACPTRAITPYRVEATVCISYLTLEHRGVVDPSLHPAMGDWLVGCDICQDVCPFNADGAGGHARVHTAYHAESGRARLPLLEVLGWREADRSRVLSGSAAKRASLDMLKRSALIAAGNALREVPRADLRAEIARIEQDGGESEVVRTTARQVLATSAGG